MHLHAAAGLLVAHLGFGDLHVVGDGVLEPEIFVDVGRRDFACRDGADDGSGAGHTVAAGEQTFGNADAAQIHGLEVASLDGDAGLFEFVGFDALADGYDDQISRDALLVHLGVRGAGSAALHLGDDLGLHPQRHGVAVLIRFDADGRFQSRHHDAFRDRAFHFFFQSRHVLLASSVDAGDLLSTQADGASHHVHRDVAAADDDDVLALEVGIVAVADGAQHLDCGDDVVAVFAFDADLLIDVGADSDVDRVVLLLDLGDRKILADADIRFDFDAGRQDVLDLIIQSLSGQTVAGDAVAKHAAQLISLLEDGHLVTHDRQIVGCRQAAGAAADDGDFLAGGFCQRRYVIVGDMIRREAFNAADVDGVVQHVAAAAVFAGVFADESTGRNEGVVLADEPHSVVVAAFVDQCDVSRNVHVGRALGYAGHGLIEGGGAAVVLDVLDIVVAESVDALQHHVCRLVADGAVCRIVDGLGRIFDELQRIHVGVAG